MKAQKISCAHNKKKLKKYQKNTLDSCKIKLHTSHGVIKRSQKIN